MRSRRVFLAAAAAAADAVDATEVLAFIVACRTSRDVAAPATAAATGPPPQHPPRGGGAVDVDAADEAAIVLESKTTKTPDEQIAAFCRRADAPHTPAVMKRHHPIHEARGGHGGRQPAVRTLL